MQQLTTDLPTLPTHAGLIPRGESAIASIGFAVAMILLSAMAALSWWTYRTQRHYAQQAKVEQTRGIGSLLARSCESLLANDDLSAVRLLISESAASNEFTQCRLVLDDGRILADTEVAQINLRKLPATWEGTAPDIATVEVAGPDLAGSFPVTIPNRGSAKIELRTHVDGASGALLQAETGIGVVGVCALSVLLVVYRRARNRLRAMGQIREALLAAHAGEEYDAALLIQDALGPEALAWNKLLIERQQLKQRTSAERATEVISQRRGARGDLDAAFDAMSQGMVLVDDSLRIKHVNGAAATFLRGKRETILGSDITAVIEQQDVLDSIRAITSGTVRKRSSIEVERTDGDQIGVLRFSIRPVRREDSASAMIIIEDITQQKVAEESRNSFVAHATHELRTPLTNIRLYIESAIEDGENDPALRGKALNVINQEARRLERIVGEMLSVSEIEAGSLRLHKDDVRLDALFDDLKFEYQPQAAEKKITLTFNLPPKLPVMQGDRDKMLLAMHNLVGNALKYTPEGGSVSVTVNADAKQLNFAVADSGFGIGPEDQEKIFDRFYRGKDTRVSKITGTGLGLTLAREVVRLHGGDVSVQSELNKGSTFTMTLPLVAEAA